MKDTSLCIQQMTYNRLMYNGVPVCTTKQLAQVYGSTEENIRKNFSRNQSRFSAGKHYFLLSGEELKAFKDSVTDSHSISAKNELILWTERGANRHSKILDTDQAWEQFENLEEVYFQAKHGNLALNCPAQQEMIEVRSNFDRIIIEFFECLDKALQEKRYYLLPRTNQNLFYQPYEKVLGVYDNIFFYLRGTEAMKIFRETHPEVGKRNFYGVLRAAGLLAGPKSESYLGQTRRGVDTVSTKILGEKRVVIRLIRWRMPMQLTTYGKNSQLFLDPDYMAPGEYERARDAPLDVTFYDDVEFPEHMTL